MAVLCGLTGSGKTRLLQALAAQGAQVLDLEALAAHRGSVLGRLPDEASPRRSCLIPGCGRRCAAWTPRGRSTWRASRKIGRVALPPALLQAMRAQGRAVWLDMDTPARVQLLLQDYAHFFADPSPSATRSTAWSSYAAAQRVLGWQRWRAKAAGPRCSRR
jgi:tRNA 2-selenouridine synthase